MFTQQCEEMLQGLGKVGTASEAAVASPRHDSTEPAPRVQSKSTAFILIFYFE